MLWTRLQVCNFDVREQTGPPPAVIVCTLTIFAFFFFQQFKKKVYGHAVNKGEDIVVLEISVIEKVKKKKECNYYEVNVLSSLY